MEGVAGEFRVLGVCVMCEGFSIICFFELRGEISFGFSLSG